MTANEEHYAFGKNWAGFIDGKFNQARRDVARDCLLDFMGMDSLKGLSFIDVGSGSGVHSLAANDADAEKIHSFDYDENSVETTKLVSDKFGKCLQWTVERGDILNDEYVSTLGEWDIVYSWGVLHHTGNTWKAIDNAASLVKPGGSLFIALYSSDVANPSVEYWMDVKQKYNAAGEMGKRFMELAYVWRFGIDRNPLRFPKLLQQIFAKRKQRGMSYMVDVRDWLGGWPMDFVGDQEAIDHIEEKLGFALSNISRGEACTEFLFTNTGVNSKKTKL